MFPAWLTEKNQSAVIDFHVQPGAKRTRIVGEHGDRLKISIACPPVDGKANKTLLIFLADALNVSKSSVELVSGDTSRQKRVLIRNITAAECMAKLMQGTDYKEEGLKQS